jgi:hypothetical protein
VTIAQSPKAFKKREETSEGKPQIKHLTRQTVGESIKEAVGGGVEKGKKI